MQNKNNFSYGFELELADIDRRQDLPENTGTWEGTKVDGIYQGSEVAVCNFNPPYRGIAVDPLGLTCTVGGEINVIPTTTIQSQLARINDIFEVFGGARSGNVNASHIGQFHVHVHVPGIREDFNMLKKFLEYTLDNQEYLIEVTSLQDFFVSDNISPFGREFLKADASRLIPDIVREELPRCKTVEDIMKLLKYPGVYREGLETRQMTSIRSGVNLSNLINGKTVEFRCFRSTTDLNEIASELQIVERFCEEALKENGKSVPEILCEHRYNFAKLNYNHEMQLGWERTCADKWRGYDIKYSQVQFKEPNDITTTNADSLWLQHGPKDH